MAPGGAEVQSDNWLWVRLDRLWVNSADTCGACAANGGNHRSVGRTPVDPDEFGHGKRRVNDPAPTLAGMIREGLRPWWKMN